MMPYKRPAADKSGMPVYQPSATTYQQLMQLQQQPFVPVSCEYTSPPPVPTTSQSQQVAQVVAAAVPTSSPVAAATAPPTASVASSATAPEPILAKAQQPVVVANHQELLLPAEPTAVTAVNAVPVDSIAVSGQQPPPLPPPALDAAALAKEVAQQNYAKAVKLAAVSQSYGINSAAALTALNYTGVALNKQPVAIPAPALPRYSALPFSFGAAAQAPTATSLGIAGLANPYAAQQPNLLAFTRPPPTVINPYSLLRPAAPTLIPHQGHLLAAAAAAQYPAGIAPQMAIPQSPAVSVAMPTQTNNNNVVLQPYKKMKTT